MTNISEASSLASLHARIRSVIAHTAGKENLLVNALSRRHIYSLDPTEEQDFIPQSIDRTEDYTEPQDTSITTHNLSISPVPAEIIVVSWHYSKFKHTAYDYKKCAGRNESLGYHHSCLNLDDENDGDY